MVTTVTVKHCPRSIWPWFAVRKASPVPARLDYGRKGLANLLDQFQKLDFSRLHVVMDKGFCSQQNIDELCAHRHNFSIAVPSHFAYCEITLINVEMRLTVRMGLGCWMGKPSISYLPSSLGENPVVAVTCISTSTHNT